MPVKKSNSEADIVQRVAQIVFIDNIYTRSSKTGARRYKAELCVASCVSVHLSQKEDIIQFYREW